jgi:hypothetical protein
MKSQSVLRQMGAVSLLLSAMVGATSAFAYPSGAPVVPPKPKAVEINQQSVEEAIDPIAYPSGTPVIPPKPKAIA